jgi:hypothetical protein
MGIKTVLRTVILLTLVITTAVVQLSAGQIPLREQLAKKRQLSNKCAKEILPFASANDSLTRSIACQFLSKFALNAPVDSAVAVLKEISASDTNTALVLKSPLGKPGKHGYSRQELEKTTIFPIRIAASYALAVHANRIIVDSLILSGAGSPNARIADIYIRLFPQDFTAFVNPFPVDNKIGREIAEHEWQKMPWQEKIDELKRCRIASELDLYSVLDNIERYNHGLESEVLLKNISFADLHFAISCRGGLGMINSEKITDFAIHRINQFSSEGLSFNHDEISYLVRHHNRAVVGILVTYLDDSSTVRDIPIEAQCQSQSRQKTTTEIEHKLKYRNKTKAYNYLSEFFGLPRAEGIASTDICVTMFKKLWVNHLLLS